MNRFLGRTSAMRRALNIVERVAASDVAVLILGETGTGKELVARMLHERSPRAAQRFVAINCAALPENLVESELFGFEPGAFTGAVRRKIGRLEYASGGTLFLDEIGDLIAVAQAKLLRALQDRMIERLGGGESIPIDIRLIAATNQDLQRGMAEGTFRADLFFRLNVVTISLPPLRERIDDIPILAHSFLTRAQQQMGKQDIHLNEQAKSTMLRYPWPGNVRELENLCTGIVALAQSGAVLGPEELGLTVPDSETSPLLPSTDLRQVLEFCEREIIQRVLERNGGNRTKAAHELGICRQALHQKLTRYRTDGNGSDPKPASMRGHRH